VFLTSQTDFHGWVSGYNQIGNAYFGFFTKVVLRNQVLGFSTEIENPEKKSLKILHCPAFTYFRGSFGWA
jgi:hypothetical protein